jgi:hypothetical protein
MKLSTLSDWHKETTEDGYAAMAHDDLCSPRTAGAADILHERATVSNTAWVFL